MGLKEIYFGLEDKWYALLDKIDPKIHIYKVIDPIDRVVPSLVLLILLVAALAVFFLVLPALGGMQQAVVTITVEDESGSLLEGVDIDYTVGENVKSAKTDKDGKISFNAPVNSDVEISIAGAKIGDIEYEAKQATVSVGMEAVASKKIILATKEPPFTERTVIFQNAAGERIAGKLIRMRLSCQNPLVTPSPLEVADDDMDGSIVVREPRDCGVFQGTIISPAEFKQKSYILNQIAQTLRLEGPDAAKGSARVKVKDSTGRLLSDTSFTVKLLGEGGEVAGQKYTQSYGEAMFTGITTGEYSVSVEDGGGNYGIANQPGAIVSANETAAIDVIVSKTIKATISVSVIDKGTGANIANASVKLADAGGKVISEKSTGGEGGTITFYLMERGQYTLYAMHEEYLFNNAAVDSAAADQSITLELERITEQNSGKVNVKVIDEDSKVVENAKVRLRFKDTGMIASFNPAMTDVNGVARFSGVKKGSYYAYVEKFPAYGDNKQDAKEIDIRTVTQFTVRLLIGTSTVGVKATDEDNLAVAGAEAEFFSEDGKSLGRIPLTEGSGQLELKADKRVYAVVSHRDFMAVQTMPQQLWPGKKIDFTAKMEPRLIMGDPKVQFDGILDAAGRLVNQLDAGKKYTVRFKVSIPEAGNFTRGGFHFRLGDERLLANDPAAITDIIAGRIDAPLKGTSFTPPLGYAEDSANITEGDAKWASISWRGLQSRSYYFGFGIRVKSQITPGSKITMHYRAWATDSSGDYIRSPADETLGVSESVPGKQSLYAKTLDLSFLEGSPSDCQEDFCYSGESILDLDSGMYVYGPYTLRSGTAHKLAFNILNQGNRQYERSEMQVSINGGTITRYYVQNASAQEIRDQNLTAQGIGPIGLGAFTKGMSVIGELWFSTAGSGNAFIEIKIVADGRIVFQRTIDAGVEAENEMKIFASPESVSSYVPISLGITVKEKMETQLLEMRDALVKITVTGPDKAENHYSKMTNGMGVASFNIPPALPNSVIKIEAEKPGYEAQPLIITVDSNVLKLSPAEIRSRLDTRNTKEEKFAVEIQNISGIDLRIIRIDLVGSFKGLLDKETMLNYAKQFQGARIAKGESITREFFKTALSKNAAELLTRNETLKGAFIITTANDDGSTRWDKVLPLEALIAMGELPDNAPCIVISKQKWETSTMENKAALEFEIQNNCVSGGNFVGLDDLQAMVKWEGDMLGTVELTIIDAGTGATNSEALKPEMWIRLLAGIRPESTYYGLLTFTPKHGNLGDTAKFKVSIDGRVRTASSMVFVGSQPEAIDAEIKIINLQQCIKYNGAETKVIVASGATAGGKFSVDATDCGNTEVSIELCQGDPNCAGGAEGGIDVSPLSFTLSKERPSVDVEAKGQSIPGMYGISVAAKVPGASFREVNNIDVLVQPRAIEDFSLDKYELNLKGTGAKDEIKLTNKALSESVSVDASVCDWGKASDDSGMSPLLGAGAGAAIAGLLGAQEAIKAAQGGMQAAAFKENSQLTSALEQVLTANDATDAANNASKAAQTAAETASNTAIQLAATDTQSAQTWSTNILPGCDAGVKATLTTANTAMRAADTTAKGSLLTDIGSMAAAAGQGLTSINSGLFNARTARGTASPNKPTEISTGPANSIKDIDSSISDTSSAIASVTKNKADLIKSQADATAILAKLKEVQTSLAAAKTQAAASSTLCTSHCSKPIPGLCCGSLGAANATAIAVTKAISSVGDAIAKTTAAKTKIADAITSADKSLKELNSAKDALGKAKTSMGRLGDVMKAGEGAASFNTGKFAGIMGTYMALGALAGALLSQMFAEDPCKERFTSTLMDYVINLKDDKKPLTIDRNGVAVEWKTDDAKVFGTYDRQEAGIDFTNSGLAPGRPVYGTFTASATRHIHNNPTVIPQGKKGFGPFKVPDARTETYSQKFHLKFNTQDVVLEIPPMPEEDSCVMGTLVGQTGAESLPKVRLNWSWNDSTGISITSCDAADANYVYCDATQFGIMVNKRIKALDEFLKENTLRCPPNPAITELGIEVEEFNNRLGELGLAHITPLDNPDCWMPRSTVLFDGKPAIMYYIEADGANIHWTGKVPDKDALEHLLHFQAYLIRDGYTPDFQADFTSFYSSRAFYDTPEWFMSSASGKFADMFRDTNRLWFRTRYAGTNQLPSAGMYDVMLNVNFFNRDWRFFAGDNIDAQVAIDMYLTENPYPDSVFYNMPFNGNIGKDSSNGRVGYGMNYGNMKQKVLITTITGDLIDTSPVSGSSTAGVLQTDILDSIKAINSLASNRGFLLDIGETGNLHENKMVYSPNYATPVLMKASQEKGEKPFHVFYQLQDAMTPKKAGASLTFWDGAGRCMDFSGVPVFEAFDFKADREGIDKDVISNWQFAYALDWAKADFGGDVYLKTVFFTPTTGSFVIKALQPGSLRFISPDSGQTEALELKGISGMPHNSKDSLDSVGSVQQVFDLVEARQACITNTGTRTAFWWNPKVLYETAGTASSISDFEKSLGTGTCIGVGSAG